MHDDTTRRPTVEPLASRFLTSSLSVWLCVCLGFVQTATAQEFIDVEPDDYPQVGNLVDAIEEHGADGVIFRLQRGGVYWTDANITSQGYHLQVVAAEGDGPPPMIRPAVDLDGVSTHPIHAEGDLTLRGIYYAGLDDVGNWQGNTRVRTEGNRGVLDDMFFDYHGCFLLRSDADDISWFITDSQFRNTGTETDPNCGRVFDSRGNNSDSLVFVNNTMYLGTHFVFRTFGGTVNYLEFDHNTVVDWGYHFEVGLTKEMVFTNNLALNVGWRGHSGRDGIGYADQSLLTFMSADPIDAFDDADRNLVISNNNIGTMRQEYIDLLEAHFVEGEPLGEEPVDKPFIHDQLIDSVGQRLMDMGVLVVENNIQEPEEELGLADRPDIDAVIEYWDAFLTDPSQELPAPWDRREELDDPITAVGVEQWRDFTYSESASSYTAGIDGFPLGDLNWFPDLKAQWETGEQVSSESPEGVPANFRIIGNYPNPFNPSTTIEYEVARSSVVTMEVYNILGEKVDERELGMQSAGVQTVNYAAENLSSGIYLVKLKAGNELQSLKITFLK